nr:leucyl aminopeptidase [Williamsia sterculiae]
MPDADSATREGVLVVGLLSSDDTNDPAPTLVTVPGVLTEAEAAGIRDALADVGANGSFGQTARVVAPPSLSVASVFGVGLGGVSAVTRDDDGNLDAEGIELVRQAAGIAGRDLNGVTTAVTTLSSLDLSAAAEGFFLGAYRFEDFRSARSRAKDGPVESVTLLVESVDDDARATVDHATHVATAVAVARDFVNTPPNVLSPAEFAGRAAELAERSGVQVEVLDDAALRDGGYGGIVGVGQGSSRPPRLVRLSYSGGPVDPSGTDIPSVALVGKGITFDTGGISIKPAANMENMTSDMGGAAAVIAATVLAARLQLGVNVTATVPMAENMPSDTAQRPGDVLTQYGGTTVEVLNTDAEGRLILADAIVRACEDEPDYLIDTATLTGAQLVALGQRTPGVMGTEPFRDRVAAVSQRIGENAWPMPLPSELRKDLSSRVADLANVTNARWGGMLVAAIFLREFVAEGVQWAHIDVAGPAFNTGGPWGYTPKGGTGVPVRTIIAVIEDIAANG